MSQSEMAFHDYSRHDRGATAWAGMIRLPEMVVQKGSTM